jgi:hypothetical protein
MSVTRLGDFIYALRIAKILITPWQEQEAYKLGIIDKDGKVLRRYRDLKTADERDAFTYLHRLVFNLKRIIEKFTAGKTQMGKTAALMLLLKEELKELEISDENWKLVEDILEKSLKNEDALTNSSGPAVSTTNVSRPLTFKLVRRKGPLDNKD